MKHINWTKCNLFVSHGHLDWSKAGLLNQSKRTLRPAEVGCLHSPTTRHHLQWNDLGKDGAGALPILQIVRRNRRKGDEHRQRERTHRCVVFRWRMEHWNSLTLLTLYRVSDWALSSSKEWHILGAEYVKLISLWSQTFLKYFHDVSKNTASWAKSRPIICSLAAAMCALR